MPAAEGSRPDRLLDVSGPQERVLRRTVEQTVDAVSPMIDVRVLREEQVVVAVLTHFDLLIPEQVIEVPKIPQPSGVSCAVLSAAEQLLEVPTIVSYSSLQQQTAKQNVDIQVPRRGDSGSHHGFHPCHPSSSSW